MLPLCLDHLHKNAGDVAIFKRKQRICLSFNKLVMCVVITYIEQ